MPPSAALGGLTPAELRFLLLELLGRVGDLECPLAARYAETVRLKGLKAGPDIKPNGMEAGTKALPKPSPVPRCGGGNKMALRVIQEERVVKAQCRQAFASTATRALLAKPNITV